MAPTNNNNAAIIQLIHPYIVIYRQVHNIIDIQHIASQQYNIVLATYRSLLRQAYVKALLYNYTTIYACIELGVYVSDIPKV